MIAEEDCGRREGRGLATSLHGFWRPGSDEHLSLALAILLLAACSDPTDYPGPPTSVEIPNPNIVLIVADDLGWHDVGFHGGEIDTPNLDRLAAEGVRLSNFRTSPACTMTRAALMTGRSAVRFGLWYSVITDSTTYGLPEAEYTIAERFRDAGYATALIGKWHLGHRQREYHPNSQGFDYFYGCMVCSRDYRTHAARDGSAHDLQRNGLAVDGRGQYLTDLITKEAIRRINTRDTKRPLLLVVSYQAPHFPLQPPSFLRKKYRDRGFSEERARYAGLVDRLDVGIGKILTVLDRPDLYSDTIVVMMSDNGGSVVFGADNSPLRGEKTRTFEGGIRVPAVIRYPGELEPGRVVGQLARERDLFATLERGAGLPLRAPAESFNLWPQLQGAPLDNDRNFFFVFRWMPTFGNFYGVLKQDRWKLVSESRLQIDERNPFDSGTRVRSTYLFDLASDPNEQTNLAAERPEMVEELEQMFLDYAATHPPGGLRGYEEPPDDWVVPADLAQLIPFRPDNRF